MFFSSVFFFFVLSSPLAFSFSSVGWILPVSIAGCLKVRLEGGLGFKFAESDSIPFLECNAWRFSIVAEIVR